MPVWPRFSTSEMTYIVSGGALNSIHSLTFDPLFQNFGHVTQSSCWMYTTIWKFIDVLVFDILDH